MDSGPWTGATLGEPVPVAVHDGGAETIAPRPEAEAGTLGQRLWRAATSKDALAVIDQAVVSGTSFVTTILVGRWCGVDELGVYSLGFTLLVAWATIQESLIALPYTIYRHRLQRETQAEYAGSALVLNGLLSALAVAVLAAVAAVLHAERAVPGLAAVTRALALVTPFTLLREFGRRFAFAHLRMGEALALDGAVAAVQLAGLAWLAAAGVLSAASAYLVVGTASGLAGAVWLYLARRHFTVRWRLAREALGQSWSLGKWLFASQLTLLVQGYFVHWLLAWVAGAAATGVYAACMTVVQFSNPLLLGVSNALAPRTAHAFSEGGGGELRRVVLQTTLLLGALMGLFCAVVLFAGDDVMEFLYRGPQYTGFQHTITVLSLAMLAAALGMPASNGLAAIERPDVIFTSGLYSAGLTLVLVPCLVTGWGVTGAAYGFLAGHAAGSLGRWLAFVALVRKGDAPASPAAVLRVLHQFLPGADAREWVVEPLSEGAQASLFAVRARDGRPVWDGHTDLVVKLFRSGAREPAEAVREQFEAMAQLRDRIEGHTINGWQVSAPLPLFQCDQPPALLMTRVPGQSLNDCLATAGQVDAATLGAIAEAVVVVMERCWTAGSQVHGDFNFDNILCDPAARSLAFVDPGVREQVFLCDGVSRHWYPASRDLAHLLYETEVGVKRAMGNPGAGRRQRHLAEGVLQAFLGRVPAGQRRRLLDEIHTCAGVHLASLRPSWTPRGVWRAFVRRVASRRIDRTLGRLRLAAEARA